jgi:hypothetical protein
VIATPTHLTVSAVCENGNTYAVGPTDGVIPGTATEVVWDVWAYQKGNPGVPLAQASYTLNIWGDRGQFALPRPGYLAKNNALQFALYTPQAYTSIEDGGCFFSFLRWLGHERFGFSFFFFFRIKVGSARFVIIMGPWRVRYIPLLSAWW